MVLVGGEAGIGKTRFLDEVRERAGDGALVLTGSCLEYTRTALGPFVDILREVDYGALRQLKVKAAKSKRQLFAGMAELLRSAAERRAFVVMIEDLHWADQASLDLLQYLAAKLGETRLTLIVTYRVDELQSLHPVADAVGKLLRAPSVRGVTLGPLSVGETSAFIHAARRDPLALATVARIARLSEGNPLFLEELLRSAVDTAPGPAADALPPTLRELVLGRIRLLGVEDQRTLAHAAALGREFDAEFLAATVGRSIEEVRDTLRRARDLRLVVERRAQTVSYLFRHALMREALYSELLGDEARELHLAVAAQLEARHPERVGELAYHTWAARDADKAFTYNDAAGDRAATMCAFADAALLYERAIEFCPEPSVQRARTREKIAASLFDAGWPKQAVTFSEAARSDYERCGDLRSAAYVCHDLAKHCFAACDRDGCLNALARAAELVQRLGNCDGNSEIFALLSRQTGRLGDLDGARRLLDQAARCGGAEHDGSAVAFFHARGLMHCMAGDADRAVADVQRALTQHPQDDELDVSLNLACVAAEFGLDALALQIQRDESPKARERGHRLQELYASACAPNWRSSRAASRTPSKFWTRRARCWRSWTFPGSCSPSSPACRSVSRRGCCPRARGVLRRRCDAREQLPQRRMRVHQRDRERARRAVRARRAAQRCREPVARGDPGRRLGDLPHEAAGARGFVRGR